jgi:dTDP-4-amino-4,6-dideoxygalactose transaminase
VDKYTWVDLGSSYLPSDLLAAFLLAQLEKRERVQAQRARVWNYYHVNLRDWAQERGVALPGVPKHCEQSYHLYYVLLPSLRWRQELIAHLKARGILAIFHYQPLHLSAMGRRFGGRPGDCPVTEDVSGRLLRLPFYNDLSEGEQARVVQALREFPGP